MPDRFNQPPSSYNDGNPNVGDMITKEYHERKILKELAKEQVFSSLADYRTMPMNTGKKIKQYVYLPIIDDANDTDQGIDADGSTSKKLATINILMPNVPDHPRTKYYAPAEGNNEAEAIANAKLRAEDVFRVLGVFDTDYNTTKAQLEAAGWECQDALGVVPVGGNLYGSEKDIGRIVDRLPVLGENTGRENRVGIRRKIIESNLHRYGFFHEWTEEVEMFDNDAQLIEYTSRSMLEAANETEEKLLQLDILGNAGIVRYAGTAYSEGTLSGDQGNETVMTYEDLVRLSISMDMTRTPKQTTIISGSTMTDTRVIPAGRIMFVPPEAEMIFRRMTDSHGNPALITSEHYADSRKPMRGEIGACGGFMIVVVQEMSRWSGSGADVNNNAGYYSTNGKYDVFPMLCVGDAAFTAITLKRGKRGKGKGGKKYKIHIQKPGGSMLSRDNPYNDKGIQSINWYHGFLCQRPERIALLKTVAPI